MTVIEKAVQWAIDTANDNSHGYSQADRWGPDYDCSSFVITAYEQAGLALREAGASYTGNMRGAFIACGFVDVTYQCGLSSGYGIQAGDVLLNYSAHTCIAIGNGKVANCRTNEGHPQSGDQSGNEIRLQAYWNYPWNCVLRYKGKNNNISGENAENSQKPASNSQNTALTHVWKPKTLQYGQSYSRDCIALQALLTVKEFPCGVIDGEFGAKTQAAVIAAQRFYNLTQDGVVGVKTWTKLLEVK